MTKDRSETDSLPGVPPGEGPPQATVFAGRGWLSQLDSWGASGTGGEGGRPICLGRAPSAGVDSVLLEEPVDLPAPGASFLGFEVIAELGRGAFGRVYLARQGDLANRLVALKVSTEMVEESQKLAQLQHTHIVPLYSLHQAGRLQAVCMPYLGSTTLADVLEQVMQGPELPVSGRQLVSTVQNRRSRTWQSLESHRSAEEIAPPGGPDTALAPASSRLPEPLVRDTLHRLEGLSYPEAILWIGARLADGLAHAHERGIVHRDLKPANVLLTDEGQPMLLDFNLSEDARGGRVEAARVGGTLPYMAPEHLEAFQGAPRAVDARSDIYSLGVMLFELLTGRHPFGRHQGPTQVILPRMLEERRAGAPSLRQWSPALSPATEQIVRTCLHPDPAQRYPSARALQEDLERQLADLPLRHVREPSPRERARKWVRRHPRLASSGTAAGVAAVLLLLLGLAFAQRGRQVQRLRRAGGGGAPPSCSSSWVWPSPSAAGRSSGWRPSTPRKPSRKSWRRYASCCPRAPGIRPSATRGWGAHAPPSSATACFPGTTGSSRPLSPACPPSDRSSCGARPVRWSCCWPVAWPRRAETGASRPTACARRSP